MSRLNVEHFMNRYFDLVQQNREIHSRALAYQSMQDTYMNSMITLMQTQVHQNTNHSRRRSTRFSPSVRTAYFDLGTIFNDVIIRPTQQQITRATREVQFNEIDQPQNTRCPISQQDFSQNDTVTQILHCGHIFYPNEINTWWERNVRCPVCRHDIREYREETSQSNLSNEEEPSLNNLNNSTNYQQETISESSTNYNNRTTIPSIRTIPRTTFSRNSRTTQQDTDIGISDQEFTSYVNLATQLLNNFSQGDISGGIDILYSIQ